MLVVRLIVAPAVIALLGDRAWGLPGWLDRRAAAHLARGRDEHRPLRPVPEPEPPDRLDRFGRMADFTQFDTRGYRTVDVRSGYGEWVATYEDTVEDAMDIDLLEALESVHWRGEAADLGCGTRPHGRVAARAGRRADRRRGPDARDARGRPRGAGRTAGWSRRT